MEAYDYRLVERLGQGGMGVVYSADKTSRGHPEEERVAIKMALRGQEVSMSEIDVLFRVNNPDLIKGWHILTSQDRVTSRNGVVDTSNSIVFDEELVTGSLGMTNVGIDVFTAIFSKLGITINKDDVENLSLKLIDQVSSALNCLEQAGYIHIDIKPDNILYSIDTRKLELFKQGRNIDITDLITFYMGDYGIMKAIRQDMRSTHRIGTPLFFPPEYYEPTRKVNISDKICTWQLGVSVLSILGYTGWETMVREGNLASIQNAEIYMRGDIRRHVDNGNLILLLKKMINLNPIDRPSISSLAISEPCNYHIRKRFDISDYGLGLVTYGMIMKNSGYLEFETEPDMGLCYILMLCRYYLESGSNGNPSDIGKTCAHITARLFTRRYDGRIDHNDVKEVVQKLNGKLFDFDYLSKIPDYVKLVLINLLRQEKTLEENAYVKTHTRLRMLLDCYQNDIPIDDDIIEQMEKVIYSAQPINVESSRPWLDESLGNSSLDTIALDFQRDSYNQINLNTQGDSDVSRELKNLLEEERINNILIDNELKKMVRNDDAFNDISTLILE